MAIQSTISAASLFEGVTSQIQGSQTQATGTKDDAFSKMLDRLISDSVDRKRDQAKDAARQTQDSRAEARAEARADASKRQQATRAERSRLDAIATARSQDTPPPPPEKADAPPAARDDSADKVRAKDDPAPRKTTTAKTDKATDKPSGKDATTATDERETAADAAPVDDTTVAAADEDATGGADAKASGDELSDGNSKDGNTTERDATLVGTEALAAVVTPNSDSLLASLQVNGLAALQATAKTDAATDGTATDGAAQTNGGAKGLDPAAELAAKLAQAQQAQAAGAAGNDATGASDSGANPKGPSAAKNGDAALTDALGAIKTGDADAQALPDDDGSAIPTSFADLIAAAKTKMGDKTSGKGLGSDTGTGRNDGQPTPNLMPAAVPPPPSGLEALKSTADSQAVGALTGTTATSASAATSEASGAHAGTAAQAHAALAAMEAPRAAGQIDMTQAAASLRPSRGSVTAPQGVPDQVAVHIKKNVADDVDQFTINLHPAELGRIDIKLDIGADGRVSAMVAVEKAQTLELLQRDSKGLERALQDAGLQTDSNSLNFSLRGEGNQSQADGSGNGSGKRGRGLRGGGDTDEDPGQSTAYTVSVGDGRLDIKA